MPKCHTAPAHPHATDALESLVFFIRSISWVEPGKEEEITLLHFLSFPFLTGEAVEEAKEEAKKGLQCCSILWCNILWCCTPWGFLTSEHLTYFACRFGNLFHAYINDEGGQQFVNDNGNDKNNNIMDNNNYNNNENRY